VLFIKVSAGATILAFIFYIKIISVQANSLTKFSTIWGRFGRPFVKRFALCYLTVVCLSCLVCQLVYCGKRLDGSRCNLGWW